MSICTEKSCYNYGKYCRIHLQAKEPKDAKIKSESEKRKELNKVYLKVRAEYLKIHPLCEFPKCTHRATDIHHKAGKIGELLIDDNHFMALCRDHHRLIENNPAWAKQNNFSISRLSKAL